jgi:hypothetical protein
MMKFLILATSAMILTIGSPAFASGDDAKCANTSGEWMSRDAAKTKAAEKGYEVHRIKREDGCYEIYAIGKDGARVELYLHPVTGEIVKTKNKS